MKLIVATDSKGGIAKDGKIPWNCPEDMGFFKTMTLGSTVIMGRNTFRSLKGPLKFRHNYIVTSKPMPMDICWVRSITVEELKEEIENSHSGHCIIPNDSWIIGGAQLYEWALKEDLISEMFVSRIGGDHSCDLFFNVSSTFVKTGTIKLSNNCCVEKWVKWAEWPDAWRVDLIHKVYKELKITPLKAVYNEQ